MSLHNHNPDTTIDLLTLIQKNIGLNLITSTSLSFSSYVSPARPKEDVYTPRSVKKHPSSKFSKNDDNEGDSDDSDNDGEDLQEVEEKKKEVLLEISVEEIVYDPEFLDECNSVFFVFRQAIASYFIHLPTQNREQENVRE